MKVCQIIPVPRGCGPHAFMLLLGAAMSCAAAMAAQPGNAVSSGRQQMPAASSGGVRPAACASCHEAIVKEFAEDPHGRPAPVDNRNATDCASCHGQGEAHARDGDVTVIFDFAKASANEVDAKCQACHGGKHANFELTAHGRGNVSCLSCHSIHAPGASKHQLKMKQPQLCYQCHSDIKPQFSQPSHHKVDEGLIECTDCHDAHGVLQASVRYSAQWQFLTCTKCHAEVAGPFRHEHAAIKADGCTACHFAHGGPNPHLLIQPSVNTICLQCHFPPPGSAAGLSAVPEHIQSPHQESCIVCHVGIHGSNTSTVFLKPRQGTDGK